MNISGERRASVLKVVPTHVALTLGAKKYIPLFQTSWTVWKKFLVAHKLHRVIRIVGLTGKIIITFLLLINLVLKMDEIKAPPLVPSPRLSTRAVPLPTASKCCWWPFCMSDTSICNGNQKSLCSVYGTNGSKRSEAPSESALKRAVDCDRKWKQSSKDRICSWGCGRAVLCGGISQASCEKYGTNGTHKHLRPPKNESKELVEELKKQKKRKRMEDAVLLRGPGWQISQC